MKNELQASDGSEETEIIRYYGAPWIKEFTVTEKGDEDYCRYEQQDEARREVEKILRLLVLPIVQAARAHVQSLRKQGVDDEDKLEIAARKFLKKFCIAYLGAGLFHVFEAPERPGRAGKRKLIEPDNLADLSYDISEKKGTKLSRYANSVVDDAELNIEDFLPHVFKENAGFIFPSHVYETGKLAQHALARKRDSILAKVARQRGITLDTMKRGGILNIDDSDQEADDSSDPANAKPQSGCLPAFSVLFLVVSILALFFV